MSQAIYRRKAILTRIRKALDAFYLLQRIDWEYDSRSTLEKILGLALGEVEFEEGKQIERGLIIVQPPEGGELEVHAGWRTDELDLAFSRTVVQKTISSGEPILCENAKHDPRFMEAESIKNLETLSLISVPIRFEGQSMGALYIESKSPRNLFSPVDMEFLCEFADAISPYIKTALTHQCHLRAIRILQKQVTQRYGFSNIIGRSQALRDVFELVRIATEVDRTVLVTGESGSGKELVASAIHYNGPRKQKPFVVVDCSSLAEHLLESELFGHKAGSFTGASSDKIGAFEEADGGTIFLDEISDASKPLQQKLRRVLQEGEIRRVGENLVRKVDVRVICATNKSLSALVEAGEFMRDLYFRINKFPIQIPPLRRHREDIPLLVEHFLARAAEPSGKPPKRMSPEALEILVERDWVENNVRELRNTVELCVDFCPDEEIAPSVVQRVFRVQRGETGNPAEEPTRAAMRPGLGSEPGSAGRSVGAAGGSAGGPTDGSGPRRGIVGIDRSLLLDLLARAKDSDAPEKGETPYYRVQLEASALAIIEGLKACGWKVRPASKLLGISPTKLRCDLKEHIGRVFATCDGNLDLAAAELEIPPDVLRRKANDLGLGNVLTGAVP